MNTTTATIRQRGQLTIPDIIRDRFTWIKTDAVVTLDATDPTRIVIQPFTANAADKPDWDLIWKMIARARAIPGKRGNLSKFIAYDRQHH